jgi:alanine dehydrogenase
VLVLGGGVAGTNAVLMAVGLAADVTVVDRSADTLRHLVGQFGTRIKTIFPTREALAHLVAGADLVIGTVLVPGAAAPKLITRDMVRTMKRGAVIVDVSIDQGGSVETSKPTTHSHPTYFVDEVIHYCVRQHAGRRRQDLDLRPQQRDAAVCACHRRQWLATGDAR